MEYEIVVGLEVHIQLLTRSKLFCADANSFGAEPNTQVSPITLAHPGTLPVLNRQAVEMAVTLGLALHSRIARHSHFDRKHYLYPDLPKGYQTSQQTDPILVGGYLDIPALPGNAAAENSDEIIISGHRVPIHHVHLEEDAGKSIHDADPDYSCIDLNRAGTPLLELVTEPAIRSAGEAFSFLTQLRKLVRWLGICDGNMEEGSLRCDANISIRPVGVATLGTKVEVKNLNSIRNVRRAIEAETIRQVAMVQNGEKIVQETRGYDADHHCTISQREKEEANDYRYFACPDLPPFLVSEDMVARLTSAMPMLPGQLHNLYVQQYGLPIKDADVLTEDKAFADYFNHLLQQTTHAKAAANWMLGPVKSWLNEQGKDISDFPVKEATLAQVIGIVQSGQVNFSMAATKLLPALLANPLGHVPTLAAQLGIVQSNDEDELLTWVEAVLARMPDKVKEYQKGKKGLIGLFVGEVKKLSKGKADPAAATKLLEEKLRS